MTRPEIVQLAVFAGGFLLVWGGVQLEHGLLSSMGVAMLGAGLTAGGYARLLGARSSSMEPGQSTASQRVVNWLGALLQTGLGLAVVFAALTSSVLGGEGLWRMLAGQPGPLLLGIGAVLLASGIQVVLGDGQRMTSRWQFVASLPIRLASLPLLLLGLACMGLGGFALILPAAFHARIEATFGPFLRGP